MISSIVKVLGPKKIDAQRAGAVIKEALSALYLNEDRFLGSWEYEHKHGLYRDQSNGGVQHFSGREEIIVDGAAVYELLYHGGMITA